MAQITIHVDDYGRSPLVSKNILNLVKKKKINQVSVLMGFVEKKIHKYLANKKIKTKLHLNLTENKNYIFNRNKKDTSILELIFLHKDKRKYVYKEIDKQIIEYKSLYKKKDVSIDGHQHTHFIPWVYKYLVNNKKYKITDIRYPVEKFNLVSFSFFLNRYFIRNLFAWSLLKLFSFFNKKINDINFLGILYTGIYNKLIFNNQIKKFKNSNIEILVHAGFTDKSEQHMFSKKEFEYYGSPKRKTEYNIFIQ